jgi:hypothetical protein
MMYETATSLVHGRSQLEEYALLKNVLIESFAIHARALALFLYPDASKRRRANAVIAEQYVSDPQRWRRDRGKIPALLHETIERTAKEIAHLTLDRHPAGSSAKGWSPEPLVRAFFDPLRTFVTHVPAGRLDVSVTAFIAKLPSPPPRFEALTLGVAMPHVTTDLTTERLSARTDVSTTSPVPRLGIYPQCGGIP